MAEQILGLTDHQCRRAPNATIGFIDGKVKAKKNKTLKSLDSKDEHEQKIFAFAINRARKMREMRRKREARLMEVIDDLK